MNKPIIEVNNVTKIFRVRTQDAIILKNINLKIDSSDLAIVFGPSGCGKSTLLHIILGLEPPTSGTCNFLQTNLYLYEEDRRSQFRKSHIGMIYQQPNWIKSLSVIENVAFALSLNGTSKVEAHAKALEILGIVGMQNWADFVPSELSSGQQQKVALARALITDPQVIIADEPTGNLDYKSGVELMELFKSLQNKGKTIIMVTHNLDTVDYASKVIQMFDGQVIKVHEISKNNLKHIKQQLISNKSTLTLPIEKYKSVATKHSINHSFWSNIPPFYSLNAWKHGAQVFSKYCMQTSVFLTFLLIYLSELLFTVVAGWKFIPLFLKKKSIDLSNRLNTFQQHIDQNKKTTTISKADLIDIAIKNIIAKKTRSIITIGGMTIGIASIVFLVSLGYGLEKLVISRVARLDEMRQIDAIPAVASNIKINDKSLSQFNDLVHVEKVLPVIGVVGKVIFNNSNVDVAVYGVQTDYLKESAIKPSSGTLFKDNEPLPKEKTQSVIDPEPDTGQVAGVATHEAKFAQSKGKINFKIDAESFVRVRDKPDTTGKIVGYTRRIEGVQDGEEIYGKSYNEDSKGSVAEASDGTKLGLWVKSKVLIWKEQTCTKDDNPNCEKGKFIPLLDKNKQQISEEGYMAELSMKTSSEATNEVLGSSTSVLAASSSASTSIEENNIATDVANLDIEETPIPIVQTKTVNLPNTTNRNAVVNRAFLKVLGLSEQDAIDSRFSISFISTGNLNNDEKKLVSSVVKYKIIGVIPDASTPIIYVPLKEVKNLGMNSYSQVKIVVDSQSNIANTRKQIEVLGYRTSSVVDTVNQIEKLFSTLRTILGFLGVIALSVAALGMFNTLTVSLLERTREVGMMKAIGMQSEEVHDLFLTESMIMGIVGGMGGLLTGYLFGKALSILLSVFSVSRGYGFIDITFIPLGFILLIIFLSITVGIVTGMYPASRATKISALDALRYE